VTCGQKSAGLEKELTMNAAAGRGEEGKGELELIDLLT